MVLYHWDLPQILQEFGGWANKELVEVFADYARVAFENFGDRVKYWITHNEACAGYGDGDSAPAVNASGVVDYLCYYVATLSHAKVYHLYNEAFREKQNGRLENFVQFWLLQSNYLQGKIGITVSINWFEPATSSQADLEATDRMRDFWV